MRKIKRYPKQEGTNFMLNYTDIIILNYTTILLNQLFFQAKITSAMRYLRFDLNTIDMNGISSYIPNFAFKSRFVL